MKRRPIAPYPQLGDDIFIETYRSYKSDDKELTIIDLEDGSIHLDEWTAEHELTVEITLEASSLKSLKTACSKIIRKNAECSIVIRWSSKGSMQSGWSSDTINLFENINKPRTVSMKLDKGSLRDTLTIETAVIISKSSSEDTAAEEAYRCNIQGAIIGYISHPSVIRVDGSGSVFPVYPTSDLSEKDPLWQLECGWDDCRYSTFGKEHVSILINTAHADCPNEWKEGNNERILSPLSKNIIRDAIGTLLIHVKYEEDGNAWKSIEGSHDVNSADFEKGSIAHALWHFFNTYEMNDSSPSRLMESSGKIKI